MARRIAAPARPAAPANPSPQSAKASKEEVPERLERSFRAGFLTVIAASAAPYGYTLAVWSSGAVLLVSRGKPTVGDVFLFIAGGLAAFGILGALIQGELARRETRDRRRDRVLAGAFDWISVGGAVGAAALIAEIPSWVAWPLAAFTATIVYFTAFGLQLALVTLRQRASSR